ncbi:hypothetical protein ILUMI_05230 [Ignelater luminosus]|uniref:Uncharacterized protein n=1 Tax=Ignelater luminosus TaxID=2038154 RepID=A0A8K0DAW4_IGNLU|nr:hypothetical protein ILUMI_05230 [Ignelater luminosus]
MFSLKNAQKSPKMLVELMCISQVKMDLEELDKFINDCNTPEDHEEMGKFFLCLWRGKGVMSGEGQINSEKLKDYLQSRLEDVNPGDINHVTAAMIVEKCCTVQGSSPRQTAIRLNNCINRTVQGK